MKRTGDATQIFNRNGNENDREELSSYWSCLFQLQRRRSQNLADPCPSSCFSHQPLASSCSSNVSTGNSKQKLKIKDLQILDRDGGGSWDGGKGADVDGAGGGDADGGGEDVDGGCGDMLYYTKVGLGSPPKEFHVQIDTGSDLLWVSCSSCMSCPRSSLLQIQLQVFDPSGSSTVSAIGCTDKRCALAGQFSTSGCSALNKCTYNVQYADHSGTLGVYLTDVMHFETVHGRTTNTSAQVMFGCSTSRVGDLNSNTTVLDGILGLGQSCLSAIFQISHLGVAPNVFSHCLKGSGSGILLLGQIFDPSIVYTPLLPLKPHYNVDLWSISVNGKPLLIRQSVFSTSNNGGTVIDSGTTLAYLPQEAYQPLVDKVTELVWYFTSDGDACYELASNIYDTFPTIELNFAGGASMVLTPGDYMLSSGFGAETKALWCIGFQTSGEQGMTILGDLVLRDKMVIYDVAKQRIGWAENDCSQHETVLESPKTKRSHLKGSSASSLHDLYASLILVCLLFICVSGDGFLSYMSCSQIYCPHP